MTKPEIPTKFAALVWLPAFGALDLGFVWSLGF
jgi:hypothetical protein